VVVVTCCCFTTQLPNFGFDFSFSALAGRKRREVAWWTADDDDMSATSSTVLRTSSVALLLGGELRSTNSLPGKCLSVHLSTIRSRARAPGREGPSRNHGSGPPSVPLLACLLAYHSGFLSWPLQIGVRGRGRRDLPNICFVSTATRRRTGSIPAVLLLCWFLVMQLHCGTTTLTPPWEPWRNKHGSTTPVPLFVCYLSPACRDITLPPLAGFYLYGVGRSSCQMVGAKAQCYGGRGQGRTTLDVALLRLRTIIGDVDILLWSGDISCAVV
jgi:hypothetical protein